MQVDQRKHLAAELRIEFAEPLLCQGTGAHNQDPGVGRTGQQVMNDHARFDRLP